MPLELSGVRAAIEDDSGTLRACPETVNLIWVEPANGLPATLCLELPRSLRGPGEARRGQRGPGAAGTSLHTVSVAELSHGVCRENTIHLYRPAAPPERPCLTVELPGPSERDELCARLLAAIPVTSRPPTDAVRPARAQAPPESPRARGLFLADVRYVLAQDSFGAFVDSVEEALLELLGGKELPG